ncbi:MAG: hypothetical protein A4E74_02265 [Syntrophus sp. PtaB.Bin075]|nr:MAG: hypothetical protein A4E74_02265 [Syntrophus sp. PtaB.Bin075]
MEQNFSEWAIIDLFGHQRIAGRVSEQQIGGSSFVRVDVPEVGEQKGFTKLFGPGAIYSITITDEMTATAAASYYKSVPMDQWSVRDMLKLPEPDYGDPYREDD